MQSKADTSQLNLLYGTNNWKLEKKKNYKMDMLRSIGKQYMESMESVLKKKGRLWWEGLAEKEGFKPGMQEWVGDGILITISMLAA